MSSRFTFDRELVIRIFFFTAFAFLLFQTFLLAKPFLPSVLIATILAMMFYPLHRRLRQKLRRPDVAALIMTLGIVLTGLIPLVTAVWILMRESSDIIPVVQNVLAQMNNGDITVYKERSRHRFSRFSSAPRVFWAIFISTRAVTCLITRGSWECDCP